MGLSRIFDTKLPNPYNDCVKDISKLDLSKLDLVREIVGLNKTYRQNDCFDLCFYQIVLLKCNCSAPLSLVNDVCNNQKQDKQIKNCFDEQEKELYERF